MIMYRIKTARNRDFKVTLVFEEKVVNSKGIQEEVRKILKTKAITALQSKTKALQSQSKIKEKEGNA